MVPKSSLSQDQALLIDKCVKSTESCHWIQGFAGSGKTIILVHVMENLKALQPTKSICFVTYTHALKDMVGSGLSDKSKNIPIFTVDAFLREGKKYSIVLADEIQDIEASKLKRLQSLCDNLIIAGDVEQSIYVNGVSGVEIEGLLRPLTHKLTVLYRLTQSLLTIAKSILPNTSISGAIMHRQQDTDIILAKANSLESESKWVLERSQILAKPGSPSVILLPSQNSIFKFIEDAARIKGILPPKKAFIENRYSNSSKIDWGVVNDDLRSKGVIIRYLGSGFGDLLESDSASIIYIMTYHSVKGLDFKSVFLPQMNSYTELWKNDQNLERRLFFVGVTRSRENLYISYSSEKPHYLVQDLPKNSLQLRSCDDVQTTNNDTEDDDFLF